MYLNKNCIFIIFTTQDEVSLWHQDPRNNLSLLKNELTEKKEGRKQASKQGWKEGKESGVSSPILLTEPTLSGLSNRKSDARDGGLCSVWRWLHLPLLYVKQGGKTHRYMSLWSLKITYLWKRVCKRPVKERATNLLPSYPYLRNEVKVNGERKKFKRTL